MIFGYNKKTQPINIDLQTLNEHILMIGSSGSGKTNLLIWLIMQIHNQIKGLWIFDYHKKDFSSLKGVDLIVLSSKNFKFNILQPPEGVHSNIWAVIISDLLCEALEIPQRASKLLQKAAFQVYDSFGGDEKMFQTKRYPSVNDLIDHVKKDKTANFQALRALIDNLEVLLLAHRDLIAAPYGYPVKELAERHIVFEFSGLLESVKNLLTGFVIISEFTRRLENNFSNHLMDLLIICDEAQRLISANSSAGSSVIKNQIGLIRGTGLGTVLCAQSSNDIISEVISNTATKIMGRCGSASDYSSIGKAMGLTSEQIEWAKLNLNPGLFIGQLSSTKFREPFVFSVPNMEKDKSKTPQTAMPNVLDHLLHVPVIEKTKTENTSKNIKSPFDTPQEYKFCKAVLNNPMQSSSKYPKLAGISSKTAQKVRKVLISKSYLKEHLLGTGSVGRSKILLEALPAANKAIELHESQEA